MGQLMLLKINRLSDGGENDTKMHLHYSGLVVCYLSNKYTSMHCE